MVGHDVMPQRPLLGYTGLVTVTLITMGPRMPEATASEPGDNNTSSY